MAQVLIIDDDVSICRALSAMVGRSGHGSAWTQTLTQGLSTARTDTFDVVFLDVGLPDGNGLEKIPLITSTPSNPEVIIMTGAGDPGGAELAIKNGAWDYIQKPASVKKMTLPFLRALQYREKKKSVATPIRLNRDGIIGTSQPLSQVLDQLAQASSSEACVLITGETGTGKELFARALHINSARRDNNFVVLDCASLPETLVESILFGHEKGAFTGAQKARDGLIKQADGGTLFLDEVGEMPLSTQKSFLRVLESRVFRPIGDKGELTSNFRLVSATNRDLDDMVRQKRFRQDLLYRLRSFHIALPPLRVRSEDIKTLAVFHMNRISEAYDSEIKGFSPEFFNALDAYDWPGNVRELVNAMEIAFACARMEPILFAKHLPMEVRIQAACRSIQKPGNHKGSFFSDDSAPTLQQAREFAVYGAEQRYLQELVVRTQGCMGDACRISGIGKTRLYELLKKYHIKADISCEH